MKRAALFAALLGALFAGAPASAAPPGALTGAGAGDPGGGLCGGAVAVTVVGANIVGDTWTFTALAVINPSGPCALVVAFVGGATGTWHPASGGCAGDAATGSVCLSAVGAKLVPTEAMVTVCPPLLVGCVSGSATIVRA